MANIHGPNIRRRGNKKRNDQNITSGKKDSKLQGKKRRQERKTYSNNDGGVQSRIKTILFAFLAFMAAIICSILMFGGISIRSLFNFDLTSHSGGEKKEGERKFATKKQKLPEAADYDIIDYGDGDGDDGDKSVSVDPDLQQVNDFLNNYVCSQGGNAYCHPLLHAVPQRRTHNVASTKSNHTLKYGEMVMALPRHLLIWDLDGKCEDFKKVAGLIDILL